MSSNISNNKTTSSDREMFDRLDQYLHNEMSEEEELFFLEEAFQNPGLHMLLLAQIDKKKPAGRKKRPKEEVLKDLEKIAPSIVENYKAEIERLEKEIEEAIAKGDLKKAVLLCREGMEVFPEEARFSEKHDKTKLWTIKIIKEYLGKTDKGTEEFVKEIIDLWPDDSQILQNLGIEFDNKRDYKRAIAMLEQANRITPDDLILLTLLSSALHRNGEYEKALKIAEQAYRIDSNSSLAMPCLVSALLANKENRKALKIAERACEIASDDPIVLLSMGTALTKMRQYKKAINILKKAEELDPSNHSILYILGVALLNNDEFEEAKERLEQANKINPDNAKILQTLGSAYVMDQKYEEAISYLSKALKRNANDPKIFNDLGSMLLDMNEYHKALECFKIAEQNHKELHPAICNNIAVTYSHLGDDKKANKYIETALSLDPTNPITIHNYEVITGKKQAPLYTIH